MQSDREYCILPMLFFGAVVFAWGRSPAAALKNNAKRHVRWSNGMLMDGKMDRTFEAFKKLVPYLRGALWWAQNDLIKDRHPTFNQDDEHKGHPLLSVSKREVQGRFDVVPMLVGTSGTRMDFRKKLGCIMVEGMTKADPNHKTYFGSIVMPGRYSFEDLLTGVRQTKVESVGFDKHTVKRRKDEHGFVCKEKWYDVRTMMPNWDKLMVSEIECCALNEWCKKHGI